jgi:hypothetical protein
MKCSLSVTLVIHNEEKHLENCLQSVHSLTNDIVIIHDGKCSDNSKIIAKKYNTKFIERDFIGIAEGHRIHSFNQTINEWILIIDADEVLSLDLINNIQDLINDTNVDAYEFIWPSYDGEKVISPNWPRKKALFRKSKIKYIDFPQADVKTNGILKRTNYVLHHFPSYNNFTYKSFKTKWLKWVNIQAKATLLDFETIEKIGYEDQSNWSNYFLFKRKFPELFLLYGFYDFYKSLISGGFKGGIYSYKTSFMWGAYNAAVYYQVLKLKWKIS